MKITYRDYSKEEQKKLIEIDPLNIKYIRNATNDIVDKALFKNPDGLEFIDIEYFYDKRYPVLKEILEIKISSAIYVIHQYITREADYYLPQEMKEFIIENYPEMIQYMYNPPESMQFSAVSKQPSAIKYIYEPTVEVCFEAIRKEPRVIKYIDNQTEELQLEVIKLTESIKSSELISGNSLGKILKNPSEHVALELISKFPEEIFYIEDQTTKLQILAISKDISVMRYIHRPTEETKQFYNSQKELLRKGVVCGSN